MIACASLAIVAERTRADFLRGVVDVVAVDMAERALSRAEKNLQRLACAAHKVADRPPSLGEYLAAHEGSR